jgi:hypothetical protein
MPLSVSRLRAHLAQLWRTDAPLTAVALLMVPVLGASGLGLWLDPRTILGAPAWLKPAKFAASIGLYSLTLTWMFGYLPAYPRLRRHVGRLSALMFSIEIGIICLQAARGTTSHFNVSTPLNGILFTLMGLGILTQTAASAALAVALWRQTFADRALGWALRLGMTIAIVGASLGGLMVQPTPAQLDAISAGRPMTSGAHSIGAPDGGPGLPGTGWSREHGDLRVPHFMGLHALQVFPLLALASRRKRWSEAERVELILAAAVSYVSLATLLLWQALRGQALIAPDATTVGALLTWVALTLVLAWQVKSRHRAPGRTQLTAS